MEQLATKNAVLDKTEIELVTGILEDHLEDCKLWVLAHFKCRKANKATRLDKRIIKLHEIIKKLKS